MSDSPMSMSPEAVERLKRFETGRDANGMLRPGEFAAKPYGDGYGNLTIGWGHTGPDVRPGMKITRDQAEALLQEDLRQKGNAVYQAVHGRVTQGQYDALTSMAFNARHFLESDVIRFHNAGRYDLAAKEIARWIYAHKTNPRTKRRIAVVAPWPSPSKGVGRADV
jgi:GH24 family phage-related lysozyme (muramidase)